MTRALAAVVALITGALVQDQIRQAAALLHEAVSTLGGLR